MGVILTLTVIAFLFFGQTPKSQYRFLPSQTCFIITTLCAVQATYGMLQYFGVLPAVNGFRITGSFDNRTKRRRYPLKAAPCLRKFWQQQLFYDSWALLRMSEPNRIINWFC
jgi:hypothetical protein